MTETFSQKIYGGRGILKIMVKIYKYRYFKICFCLPFNCKNITVCLGYGKYTEGYPLTC